MNDATILFKASDDEVCNLKLEGTGNDLIAGMITIINKFADILKTSPLDLLQEMTRRQEILEIANMDEAKLQELIDKCMKDIDATLKGEK